MKKLYIKQKFFKITDHYPILDENREPIYYVDQDFTFVGLVVHVSDKDHREIFTIEKELFHLLPEFVITFADGKSVRLKMRFALFHKAIDVISPNMNISIEGDFLSREFVILNKMDPIGRMTRKILTIGDYFEIELLDEEHMDLIVAIMIAMDYLIDISENSN